MDWDYDSNTAIKESDTQEISGSIIAPKIGVKAYIFGEEKLKGYVNAAFTKPFFSGKLSEGGEEDEEIKETIDKLSLFGLQAGFGAEYFIDSNFSISGEFGISYMKGSFEDPYEGEYRNPITNKWVQYEGKRSFKANLLPTYSMVSLNFYF